MTEPIIDFDKDALAEKQKQTKKNIAKEIRILEESNSTTNNDLAEVIKEGWIYARKYGKPNFKRFYCVLNGDFLYFYKTEQSLTENKNPHAVYEITYAKLKQVLKEDGLTRIQLKEEIGELCTSYRVKVVTIGQMFDFSGDTDDDVTDWHKTFKQVLKLKYSKEQLVRKEAARKKLEPHLKEQESMLVERYKTILRALHESGFFIDERTKKEKEGYLRLERARGKKEEWRKLYIVLYKDYLYFFKPHEKVSLNNAPYNFISLRFITEIEITKSNCFKIYTPLRTFHLKAKHDVAAGQWVTTLYRFIEKKTKKAVRADLPADRPDNKGYVYLKPLTGRMMVVQYFENGKKKVYKLKGHKNTLGRSSSCTVRFEEDQYISRSHCSINLINNVPYLVDMGASSTKLNGATVSKCALKPGDMIKIGKTVLTFEVKGSDQIFSHGSAGSNARAVASNEKSEIELSEMDDSYLM